MVLSFSRKLCNWERSFPFPGKVATGKGPFLSQESLQLGKDSSILGKVATGKGPFLSQERTTLQLGKDSSIWESLERGKERKAFRTARLNNAQKVNFGNGVSPILWFIVLNQSS